MGGGQVGGWARLRLDACWGALAEGVPAGLPPLPLPTPCCQPPGHPPAAPGGAACMERLEKKDWISQSCLCHHPIGAGCSAEAAGRERQRHSSSSSRRMRS